MAAAAAAAHFERAVLAGSKVKYSVILALQQVSWVGWPRDRPTGRHLAELHRAAEGKRCSGRGSGGGRQPGWQVEHIDSPDGGGDGGGGGGCGDEDVEGGGDSGPVGGGGGGGGAQAMVSPPARLATCECCGSEREGNMAGKQAGRHSTQAGKQALRRAGARTEGRQAKARMED